MNIINRLQICYLLFHYICFSDCPFLNSVKQTCASALLRHLAHINLVADGARIYMLLYIRLHKICVQCWSYASLRLCRVGQAVVCIFSLNEFKPVFPCNQAADYLHEECKYLEISLVTLGRSNHLGKDKVWCGREKRLRSTSQRVSEQTIMFCLVLGSLYHCFWRYFVSYAHCLF